MSKTKNHIHKSVQLSRCLPGLRVANIHPGVPALNPNPFVLTPAQFRSTLTLSELGRRIEGHHHTTTLARGMTEVRETRAACLVLCRLLDNDNYEDHSERPEWNWFRANRVTASTHAAMLLSCCLHVCNAVVVLSLMCVCTSTALTI